MISVRTITRIFVWTFVLVLVLVSLCLYFFGDINKLKSAVEQDLKSQLNCTVKLGELDWDWDGLKLGVTASDISLYDKENNLVLQAGPTRFVWHLKNIITGSYSHFYKIESTNLYLNVIHYSSGAWNLIAIFPPGPPPKVDNLELHNSIIYFIDELNLIKKAVLYKDFNINFDKKLFSKLRKINLTTRIDSLDSPSFVRIKGHYTERKKFDWKKSEFNLSLIAKKINLANWERYFANSIKELQIKKMAGEFTGVIHLKKNKNDRLIKIRSRTNTKDFLVEFQKKDISQLIEIPKTDFVLHALVDEKKIDIRSFRSNIDELTYDLYGYIINWSKVLPEVDLALKTNKFNFKSVKPYLPLSLLPQDTRARIEPINDDGFVELDLKLKGPLIAPKYYGTVLLDNFNLTAESGFLNIIQGLGGKLTLNDEVLKIDYLNIPVENSLLVLKGEIDNKNTKTSFNLSGNDLNVYILQDLLTQISPGSSFLKEAITAGKLDLNLDVVSISNLSPEIKGKINFHDTGIFLAKGEPLGIKNIVGELLLNGSKISFNRVTGLIDNENFSIQGDLSLKGDEKVNLQANANHLKVVPFVLSFLAAKTPFKPIAKTVSGEVSNLDLSITGSLPKPLLYGMLLINNVSFSLPNLTDKISNLTGSLKFGGTELTIEELNGKVQSADFFIAGYIGDLFSNPKPRLRLVTSDIEISSFWNYLKEGLKITSLNVQKDALEKLKGIASLDVFLHPDLVLGNIYFKDAQIKYKPLPFDLSNLNGRLVIGEKNLSLFGLTGNINNSNNFNCDLTVFNYLDPSFYVQGRLGLDLDLPSALKAINSEELNTIKVAGLIPTIVNFEVHPTITSLYFYSNLNEGLELEFDPYIKKPVNKAYVISGGIDFDSNNTNLYFKQINLMAKKLSITTNGDIKNISSKNPELMLNFVSDEPCGLFMIVEPIVPLMGYKIWGMIELNGSISGTPSMYSVSTDAMFTDIEIPELFSKKLTAQDGVLSVSLNNEKGTVNSKVNNVNYVSLKAKSILLSLNYLNPVVDLNELSVDGDPGRIFATGSYDPRNSTVNFTANGSDIDLSSLGSFIFLDPTKLAGMTNFSFMISGAGKTKDEILKDANGSLSLSVTDGKLGQVALLERGIQLANIFKQGIFGFNLKNIFSLFFKYQDGSFNTIKGELELNKGVVKAKEFNYRAKDLFLNAYGLIDLIKSFVKLSFYGYVPKERTGELEKSTATGVLSIVPEALGKQRFFIPFLSASPKRYFKFEVEGNIKKPKKITGHARHSFRWLGKKQLKKEYKYLPKPEN